MSAELDAVVLAGGKSERLTGIVPPHHKPFIVVNGESLVVSAVQHARAAGAGKIVVVTVGQIALPIYELVGAAPDVRVVLGGGGPAHALRVGLEMCDNQRVLVLMSDNVHRRHEVLELCAHTYAVGVRQVPRRAAERFTRVDGARWVEGPYAVDPAATLPNPEEPTTVWCGPLLVQRARSLDLLGTCGERIGPLLDQLAPTLELVNVTSEDVGVPDAVREATRETSWRTA